MNFDALSTSNFLPAVIFGDFNTKSSNWYLNEITSFEGLQIEFQVSQIAMSQANKGPTYIF